LVSAVAWGLVNVKRNTDVPPAWIDAVRKAFESVGAPSTTRFAVFEVAPATGDWVEVTAFSTGTFPEPLAFSVRAAQYLRGRVNDFDLVQDNQSLGYGLLAMERMGLPVLATIHHPITVDRRLEMEHAETKWQRMSKARCVMPSP